MKKLLLALALSLAASVSWADCTGVFPGNTLCGNLTATPQPPAPFSASTSIVGPGSSVIGDIAVWANVFGSQLKDVPPLQIFGTESANCIFAGPVSGTANFPTCRGMVLSDLPQIGASTVLANFTGGNAVPAAASVPSCANDGVHALTNNAAGGFNCTPILFPPGGRLVAEASSCSGALAIQINSITTAQVVCYVPYGTNLTLIAGGNYSFSTLTLTPTGATNPNIYDIYLVLVTGVPKICYNTTPWTNASTPADPKTLQANQTWTNSLTITTCSNAGSTVASGVTAGNALWIGAFYATGAATTAWNLTPLPANGGTANILGVCNVYNQVGVEAIERELTSQWAYGSSTWRPENNSTGNRISILDCLGQDQHVLTEYMTMSWGTGSGAQAGSPGICVNCISTPAVTAGNLCQASFVSADEGGLCTADLIDVNQGLVFYQAVEAGTAIPTTVGPDWYGNYDSSLRLRMHN